jgi:hypothetical protein
LVERFFNKIKQCRRVLVTIKLAANYLAIVELVSIRPRLLVNEHRAYMKGSGELRPIDGIPRDRCCLWVKKETSSFH